MIAPPEESQHERRDQRHHALHLRLLRIRRRHAAVADAEIHRPRVEHDERDVRQREARREYLRPLRGERASDPCKMLRAEQRLVLHDDVEDAVENRKLHDERQASRERVDAGLAIERHRLLLQSIALNCLTLRPQKTPRINAARMIKLQPRL